MARSAVRQTSVVKAGILEVARVLVAGAARSRKMVGRRIMTGRAILPPNRGMVEVSVLEVARVLVTSRAGTAPMVGRSAVAGTTIGTTNR